MFYVANYEDAIYDPPELIVTYKPRRVYTLTWENEWNSADRLESAMARSAAAPC